MKNLRELEATEQLDCARNLLTELSALVTQVIAGYSPLDAPEVRDLVAQWGAAATAAHTMLQRPVLSIATIGTTSSGKSTLLNALAGRRVAPMADEEFTAGVLTLRHSERRRLVIDAVDGAPWAGVEEEGLSDREAYERLKECMLSYKAATRDRESVPYPTALVEGPLLPGAWTELIGLPKGVGVEFVDLPGLKSIKDKKNLEVLQRRIHRSVCLVAIDYMNVQPDAEAKLLEELRRVSDLLEGQTASMLFVLNRVDLRAQGDKLEDRLERAQSSIVEALSLDEAPTVLPLNARLLYYTQSAWGPTSPLDGRSSIDDAERRRLLEPFSVDCAQALERMSDDAPKGSTVDALIASLRKKAIATLSAAELEKAVQRLLTEHVYEGVGGKALWDELRRRVRRNFWDLVVLPALSDVLEISELVLSHLGGLIDVSKVRSAEGLEAKRQQLEQARVAILTALDVRKGSFKKKLETARPLLRSSNPADLVKLTSLMGDSWAKTIDAANEVEADLSRTITRSIVHGLEAGRRTRDVQATLGEYLPDFHAQRIADALDALAKNGYDRAAASTGYSREARASDAAQVAAMADLEKAYRSMYARVRKALEQRAEVKLQGQAHVVRRMLAELLEQELGELKKLALETLGDPTLADPLFGPVTIGDPSKLRVPENLIQLPKPEASTTIVRDEVVGRYQEQQSYESGSCLKETKYKTVTRDRRGNVEYVTLRLKSANEMEDDWSGAIASAKTKMYDVLVDWISGRFDDVAEERLKRANHAMVLFQAALERREKEIASKAKSEEAALERASKQLEVAQSLRGVLVSGVAAE